MRGLINSRRPVHVPRYQVTVVETARKFDSRIEPDHQEDDMESDSVKGHADLEDRALILRARGGDMRALEKLVYRYDEKVLSMAVSFVGNVDDAKDVYQEVFIRVFKALPKFEFRSRFSTYLYRIVTNVCLTHRTKHGKNRFVSIEENAAEDTDSFQDRVSPVAPDQTDALAINNEFSARIRAAVGALSPRQRTVFVLRHHEGFKLREIAGIIECTEGAVKKYLFDATRRLREQLKDIAS